MVLSETLRQVDIQANRFCVPEPLFIKVCIQIWRLAISIEDVFGTLAPFTLQLSFFGADEACGIFQISNVRILPGWIS